MVEWEAENALIEQEGTWTKDGKLVIPDDHLLRWEVCKQVHGSVLAGHPGIQKTIALASRQFWWPQMKRDLTEYVKGCEVCQSTKPSCLKQGIPLFPITPESLAQPFSTIALDLIVDLPNSEGFDSILTVMDHDVSKVAVFIPCNKTATGEDIAKLYAKHIFPHFGVPSQVISDCDT
jgi:hypothetical protein